MDERYKVIENISGTGINQNSGSKILFLDIRNISSVIPKDMLIRISDPIAAAAKGFASSKKFRISRSASITAALSAISLRGVSFPPRVAGGVFRNGARRAELARRGDRYAAARSPAGYAAAHGIGGQFAC